MRPPSSRGSGFSLASEGSSSGKSYRSNNVGGRSVMTAAGISRNAMLPVPDLNISNRPVTGAGGLARINRRHSAVGSTSTPTRIIESAGYYSNLLQSKTDAIVNEICRLRSETEMADSNSEFRRKLECEFNDTLKDVQKLEGELADYNLARDKARSGASHQDINDVTVDIANRNTRLEREVDEIFLSRKKTEDEITKIETKLKRMHAALEKKFLEGDPDKLSKYQSLVQDIEGIHEERKVQEESMAMLRNKIKMIELKFTGQGFINRYKEGEKHVDQLKQQIEEVENDIELARVDENEARAHLLEKVKSTQAQVKEVEEKSSHLQSEIESLQKEQMELRSDLRIKSYSEGGRGSNPYDRLFKKHEAIKKFFEDLPQAKDEIEKEQSQLKATIQALLDDISKGITISDMSLPSRDELEMLKEEVTFTNKNLDNSQETINRLQQQKKTRVEELERINTLDEKISNELKEIDERTGKMKEEIEKFKNLRDLQESADATKDYLLELTEKFTEKIESIDNVLEEVSPQYEEKVKALNNSETWKELDALKLKIREQGSTLFELQEEVNKLKAKTDYGGIKASCLDMATKMNSIVAETA